MMMIMALIVISKPIKRSG